MNPNYHTIAASAELLHDRIRNGHRGSLEPDANHADHVRELLQELDERHIEAVWSRRADDPSLLATYVAFERWPEAEPLPEWIDEFDRIVDIVREVDDPSGAVMGRFADIPFVDILQPIADYKREGVASEITTSLVGESALNDFQEMLLSRLKNVTAQALHIDFVRYIAERDSEVVQQRRRSPDSTKWYDEYVATWYDHRAASFFEEYSVAAKLLTVALQQWRSVVTSFAERLERDRPAIRSELGCETLDRVTKITPKGDAHGGNERVLEVKFGGEETVFYKPRCIDPEAALYKFEDWLSGTLDHVPKLDTPSVLVREDYGWVAEAERVDHDEVDSVQQYYGGAGALLAVTYLLNVTDCHCENLVGTDHSPVIVDPETIMEMGISVGDDSGVRLGEEIRRHIMSETVIGTGQLPHDAIPNHASGLAGVGERTSKSKNLIWTDTNTDAMDIKYERASQESEENTPMYRGSLAEPGHFLEELVGGFEITYQSIEASSDQVASAIDHHLGDIETRVLLRSTRAYAMLLDTLTSPKYLRDGARFDLEIQTTLSMRPNEPTLQRETKLPALSADTWDSIIDAERDALQRGDIPKFTMYSDDTGLYFDGEPVLPDLTEYSGIERIYERLNSFSNMDRRRQSGLIRGCLAGPDTTALPHPEGRI